MDGGKNAIAWNKQQQNCSNKKKGNRQKKKMTTEFISFVHMSFYFVLYYIETNIYRHITHI